MKKPKFISEFADIPTARTKMPELPLEERRLNFKEVELGFTEELARQEAARCLSCRRCIGCGLCLAECDQAAVVYDQPETTLAIEADAIVFASDAEVFKAGRKRDLGYGEAWNVITSFEFERLTSPTGPFGGILVRPSDGEVPKRIAFVQCVGSRDEAIGANYCSAECCSRTLTQAQRSRAIADDVEVSVFHRGLRPYGKRSELDLAELAGAKWARLVEGAVTSIKEDPATGGLTLSYVAGGGDEPGSERSETFDLVVLAVGVASRRDFRRHARLAGAVVNKYGFVDSGVSSQIALTDGVAFAGGVTGPEVEARSVLAAIGAASRALGSIDLPASPAGSPAQSAPAATPLIFACEYGLELAAGGGSRAASDRPGSPPSARPGQPGQLGHLPALGAELAGSYPFLCYRDGREAIRSRLAADSRLVVVGCHRGSHEQLFERMLGLRPGAVSIIGPADLSRGAEALLAASGPGSPVDSGRADARVAAARPSSQADPDAARATRTVAILGGGVSGLAAASELVRRGLKVTIIERSQGIGAGLAKAALTADPAGAKLVEDFVKRLERHPNARIIQSAELTQVARKDGEFSLTITTSDGSLVADAAAIVVATGAEAATPVDGGLASDVPAVSQADFRAALAAGDTPWQRVVMMQCVGARDERHPYCSRYCCREALENALAFKQLKPEAEVAILHKGIRVFGLDEELYTEAVERGINFIELGGPLAISSRGGAGAGTRDRLVITGRSKGGQPFSLDCDRLVLSMAHRRRGDDDRISQLLGAPLDRLGFFETANPLVRPFAARGAGVFVCGFARGPVTVEEAFAEGIGAAGAVCAHLASQ